MIEGVDDASCEGLGDFDGAWDGSDDGGAQVEHVRVDCVQCEH